MEIQGAIGTPNSWKSFVSFEILRDSCMGGENVTFTALPFRISLKRIMRD